MADNRVFITGIGIVSPIGIGRKNFWDNIASGISGISKITLFDAFDKDCSVAAEVKDTNFARYLGTKGLKWLDKSTRFLYVAVQSALKDSGYPQENVSRLKQGVVIGTDWSCLQSNIAFHTLVLKKKHKLVSPMDFPKALTNAPSGHVAIKYGLEGLNATISRGFASSLDAISYAADKIRQERLDMIIAGGVENLSIEFYTIFDKSKKLLSKGRGIVLGEGACVFILEKADSAIQRKAHIFAEVSGIGFSFGDSKESIKSSMLSALDSSGLAIKDVDYICANYNGDRKKDLQESSAISELFMDYGNPIVRTIKPQIGECFGVSGAMQAASACLSFYKRLCPRFCGEHKGKDFYSGRKSIWIKEKQIINVAMINSFGLDGNNSCLILKRHDA